MVKFIILSFIALLIHNWVQKYYSKKVGATTKISLWSSKYKFKSLWSPKQKFRFPGLKAIVSFPSGIVIPILISFISLGQIYFAATTKTEISIRPAYRIGRRYLKLTGFEQAKIAMAAPLVHIVLAIILSSFNIQILQDFALVNTMIAISTMLPIPGLLGITVLLYSKPAYVFSAIFILASALLLRFLTGFSTIILAFLLAALALFIYFWRFFMKK